MSERFMRIIIMFDLPTESLEDKRNYRDFRKLLIENGFLMLQKSVYCKLALNGTKVRAVLTRLRAQLPRKGLVQALVITEKQFAGMELLVGETNSNILGQDQVVIIL